MKGLNIHSWVWSGMPETPNPKQIFLEKRFRWPKFMIYGTLPWAWENLFIKL